MAVVALVAAFTGCGVLASLIVSDEPPKKQAQVKEQAKEQPADAPETATPTAEPKKSPKPEPEKSARGGSPPKPEPASPTPSSPEPVKGLTISRVIDGDTIELDKAVHGTDTVRLIGMDAPESCQPLGDEATWELELYENSRARLEFDEDLKDQYDRLLAYVYTNNVFDQDLMLNEEMLRTGLAQVYTVSPNDKYEGRFLEAQQAAKNEDFAIGTLWALSKSERWQLADHGNGIGNGEGSCTPEPTPAPSTASPSATASPSPAPGDGDPNRDRDRNAPSSPAPGCESGIPAPYPNHPEDGDNDGCIHE